jgi:hypothetical protein
MNLSEDFQVFEMRRAGEQRLLRDLERRRVIAERLAESGEAGNGVTDAARPRRGIRQLLPRRLRPVMPARPAAGGAV